MTKGTMDCPDCGVAVPHGRLSCQHCGTLLAAVTASRAASTTPAAPVEETVVEAWAATVAQAIAEPIYLLPDPPEPVASPWPPAPEPVIDTAHAHEVQGSASTVTEEPDLAPIAAPVPDWADQPVLAPRPYPSATARTTSRYGDASVLATAAAYRSPTMTVSAAGAATATWPGAASASEAPAQPVSVNGRSRPALVLDPARASELGVWFVIVGATLGLLGFLLPWSRVVIGSGAYGDYFANWGLAGPSHVLIVLGLMGMLALAVLQTPVPAWLSSGVLGLAGGALLLGLVWPYLIGPLGADVGVLVTALGGVALICGGILATWATHHAEAPPGV